MSVRAKSQRSAVRVVVAACDVIIVGLIGPGGVGFLPGKDRAAISQAHLGERNGAPA
jgi:hypothetical protein